MLQNDTDLPVSYLQSLSLQPRGLGADLLFVPSIESPEGQYLNHFS